MGPTAEAETASITVDFSLLLCPNAPSQSPGDILGHQQLALQI